MKLCQSFSIFIKWGAIKIENLELIVFIKGIFSSKVGTIIFLIEIMLFIADIVFYTLIYKHLVQVNKSIENESFEPFKDLIIGYENLIKRSLNHINTQSYIEAYFSKYKIFGKINIPLINIVHIIQMTISIFILMGVLGTFTGLTVSLNSLKMGDISTDITKIGPILSGMGVAFNASIVGITFSLILTVATKVFNVEQLLISIMSKLENYMDNKLRNDNSTELFNQVTSAVEKLSSSTKYSIDEMKESVCFCLNETRETFEKAINNLSKSNNKTIEDLNSNINKVAEESKEAIIWYTNNLASSNRKTIDELNTSVKDSMNKSLEVIKEIHGSVQGFYIFSQQFEQATAYMNNFNGQLNSSVKSFEVTFKKFSDFINVFNKGMNNLDAKFGVLDNYVNDINNQQRKVDQSYGSIYDKLGKLSDDFYGSLKDLNYVQKTFLEQIKSSYDDSNKKYIEEANVLNDNLNLMSDKFTYSMSENILKLSQLFEKEKEFVSDIDEKYESLLQFCNDINGEYIKQTVLVNESFNNMGEQFKNLSSYFGSIEKQQEKVLVGYTTISNNMEGIQNYITKHSEEQTNRYSETENNMKEYLKKHEDILKDISKNIQYVNECEKEVAVIYEGVNNTASNIQEKYTKVVEELNGVTTMLFQVTGSLNSLKDLSSINKEFNINLTQLTNSVNEQNNLISYLAATTTSLSSSSGENKENKKQDPQESLPEY